MFETTANALFAQFDELEAEADKPEHRGGGAYGITHDHDCPACLANEARFAERKNPHRPGTKAAAKWEREQSWLAYATSPRSETYWAS